MDFFSAYAQGFARVAACTVPVTVADPQANAAAVLAEARACHEEGVAVAVFGELVLSGYSAGDLLLQDRLLDAVEEALAEIVAASTHLLPLLVVGAPLTQGNRVLNTAVAIHRGQVLGVVPKSYLANHREFYERRWFAPGDDRAGSTIRIPGLDRLEGVDAGREIPCGPDLLFRASDVPGLVLHVEVCEDMWVPVPPSAGAALAGATVLANLSSSPVTVARAEDRRLLVRSASLRLLAASVYAAAGPGESTTDLAWDGQTMVYECGELLAESERFPAGARRSVADVDLDRLHQERLRQPTFDDNRRTDDNRGTVADRRGVAGRDDAAWHGPAAGEQTTGQDGFRTVTFAVRPPAGDLGLRRRVDRFPFVPAERDRLAQDCYEAYHIQVAGLTRRLQAIGEPRVVLGVSGGIDSTHALIVAARAMDRLERPRRDIHTFTLPGFATTEGTRSQAVRLAGALGVSCEEVDITPAARQMLADLDHPAATGEPDYDVTFENVQAGLRTDYLFRLANHRGGMVLGTGDLSELALGWCTYGVGDQMAHYGVNAGVPKTLIQHLIRWVVDHQELGGPDAPVNRVLAEILDQEITPELVPAADGDGPQATEDLIGPYALHDFTLYHLLRRGASPRRIAFLAWHAWHDAGAGEWPPGFPERDRVEYDLAQIRCHLEIFVNRFFANQFKRSALPDGPKVSPGGTLSPRGDWRMPSDVAPTAWLAEIEADIP